MKSLGGWLALVAAVAVVGACGAPAARSGASKRAAPAARELRVERGVPHETGAPGPMLSALQAELRRAMSTFRQKVDLPPYFLSYSLVDERTVNISASHGAAFGTRDERSRTLDVDLRVGDPKLDSTHTLRGLDRLDRFLEGWDDEALDVPLEDDAGALRALAWLRTEEKYRRAVERLAKVRAERKVKVLEEDQSDDFSSEPPVTHIEPPATMQIDRARWEALVREYSRAFVGRPEILESSVTFEAHVRTRSFVSSEGSAVQAPWTNVRLSIWARTKADDGMDLSRHERMDASSPVGLPDDVEVRRRIARVIDDLRALREAPVAEPWSGPAILEGRAAGVFFHEVFGHRVEGQRQKREGEGQTFARKLGRLVMPELMQVYDDPTLRRIEGIELNGHYLFDDEGVPAQRADLVTDGVLKTFLMSRSPTRGITRSNGHGRRQKGHPVVARQGNLIVSPSVRVPVPELKRRLLAEVRRQRAPYGLRFREVEGGYTMTDREALQAFKVLPVVVYRVYPDGREDLVRGVDLEGTPLSSLSRILAAGDDFDVFNGHCGAESGWVPVSAASPSLLIEEIEVTRKSKDQERPPILPPPPVAGGGR